MGVAPARELVWPLCALVHANCGEEMAIARAIRKTAGRYRQIGEIPARFVATLLSIEKVELTSSSSGRTPSRPAISSPGDVIWPMKSML
jgi:hypothetical protein